MTLNRFAVWVSTMWGSGAHKPQLSRARAADTRGRHALSSRCAARLSRYLIITLTAIATYAVAPASAVADQMEEEGWQLTARLALGMARVQEGDFLRLHPLLVIKTPDLTLSNGSSLYEDGVEGRLRLDFSLPMHWRMTRGEGQPFGRFRRADWDETEDFLGVLRTIEFGKPSQALHLRGGELANVRVGNRSIVDQFRNVVEIDRFRWGLQAATHSSIGGFELLLDSVVDPGVIGGRLYTPALRPFGLGWFTDSLELGATLVVDPHAPRSLARDQSGRFRIDSHGRLITDTSETVSVLGFDLSAPMELGESFEFRPYLDANTLIGYGSGAHIGARFGGSLMDDRLGLEIRAETILIGQGYAPRYFGPLYQTERMAWRRVGSSTQRLPRLEWLKGADPGFAVGGFGELSLRFSKVFAIELAAWDQQGQGGAGWWTRLTLEPVSSLRLALWWVRGEADSLEEAFVVSETLGLAELTFAWTNWLYTSTFGSLRPVANAEGRYESLPEGGVMVGVQLSL